MDADQTKAFALAADMLEGELGHSKFLKAALDNEQAKTKALNDQIESERTSHQQELSALQQELDLLHQEGKRKDASLAELQRAAGTTRPALAALEKSVQTSFTALNNSVAFIENKIRNMKDVEPTAVDLSGVMQKLSSLQSQVIALINKEPRQPSSEWIFTPQRDMNGNIANVTARRK